jgi:hypothetical protein
VSPERSLEVPIAADPDAGTGKLLADGAHAGTAWLITAKHALTAAHCIGDRVTQATAEAAFSIEFRDGVTMGCRVARIDWKLDVALLELEGEARQTPVPIGDAPPPSTEPGIVAWRSFGYPVAHPEGMTLSGTVTSLTGMVDGAPAIELECKQGGAGNLEGASGSPVRRGRIAFGLIRFGPPALQQRVVHAISLALVAAVFEEVRAAWLPLDLDLSAYSRALGERTGIGGGRLDGERFVPLFVRAAVAGSERIGLLEALRRYQRILVRGEAGGGKSTSLRQLAMRSASGAAEGASDGVPDALCLYLPLAELDPHYELAPPWEALLEFVAEQLAALRAVPEKPRRDKVAALLERTAPILLFDGCNEIAPKQRTRFAEIAVACAEHGLRFVITDRPETAVEQPRDRRGLRLRRGAESARADAPPVIPATEMTLLGLDNQQLEQFSRSRVDSERAAIVVEEAQRNPLLRVPLFADMALALDSAERSSLESATALVADYVRELTTRWASRANLGEEAQRRVIRAGRLLAGRMDQSYRVGAADAMQAFAKEGLLESAAAENLSSLKACGLVRVDASDGGALIAFTHQALQEHFLAGWLADRWRVSPSRGKRLPTELRETSEVLQAMAKLKATFSDKPPPSPAQGTLREAAWVHLGAVLDDVELDELLPLLAIRNRLLAIRALDELALARRDVRLDPPLRQLTRELRRISWFTGPLFLVSISLVLASLSGFNLASLFLPNGVYGHITTLVTILGLYIFLWLMNRYGRVDVLQSVLRTIQDVRSPEMQRVIESFVVGQMSSDFAWKAGLAKTLLLALRKPERAIDLLRATPALHHGIACLVYSSDPQAERILERLGETRTAYSRIACYALVQWRRRWHGASTEERIVCSDEVDIGRRVARRMLFVVLPVFYLEELAILYENLSLWIVVLLALEHLSAVAAAGVVARRNSARSMAGTSAATDPAGWGVPQHCILAALFGMAYVLTMLLPYRDRMRQTARIDCDWIEAQLAASTLSRTDAGDGADNPAQ